MDKTERLTDWVEDEKKDRNRNGIDDNLEPPIPDVRASTANLARRLRDDGAADPTISGGDLDVRWESAEGTGDESAVSSMPSPEQNDTGAIGASMGITYADDETLKVGEKERSRDLHRWELDPASSEDYRERAREQKDS